MDIKIDLNKQTVVPDFYLGKICQCPCLIDIVQKMFEKRIKGYQQMYDELHWEKLFGGGGEGGVLFAVEFTTRKMESLLVICT